MLLHTSSSLLELLTLNLLQQQQSQLAGHGFTAVHVTTTANPISASITYQASAHVAFHCQYLSAKGSNESWLVLNIYIVSCMPKPPFSHLCRYATTGLIKYCNRIFSFTNNGMLSLSSRINIGQREQHLAHTSTE
jgi:hypothetical protein